VADCLVITALADEFEAEIARLSGGSISVVAVKSTDAAREAYGGESVLFGNPAMIAPLLDQAPDIRWIQSSWAGVTPLIEAPRRDYVLTGVKGVFGPQMSEYVFGYLLAHELKLLERHRQQSRRQWYRDHSGVLEGKSLGIMGTGSIGAHIAATARAFGMTPIGFSRSGAAAPPFEQTYAMNQLEAFLAHSDHLVGTLPDTRETDGLLNREAFALLPEGAYFVNVGRSNCVDDEALIEALQTGRLAGAALDVFDEEPVPDDNPLWDAPNLSITAHIAAISHPLLIVPIFVDNYRRYVADQPLNYIVDFDAGY
jgi:phosphoglycerate dehydrogenase-like enzyme